MDVTATAANTSRGSIEAGGERVGPSGGGTATAQAGTYDEVTRRPRWLCICMRMA